MYDEIKLFDLNIEASGSVEKNIIEKYEKELGLEFGIQYKIFLEVFGCLNIEYLEFYGICGNNNSIPSSIHATKELRKYKMNLPSDFVLFYEIGNGISYCTNNKDEVYKLDLDNITNTNKDFKQFILDEIKKLG